MRNSREIIAELDGYLRFLHGLQGVNDQVLAAPIGEGKWSVRDILAHIMMWDRNCVERKLEAIEAGMDVRLQEDVDAQAFNERAAEYGRALTASKVLEESILHRSRLVRALERLPESAFGADSRSPDSMTLATFLERMFIAHDRHHMRQIEACLSGRTPSVVRPSSGRPETCRD